ARFAEMALVIREVFAVGPVTPFGRQGSVLGSMRTLVSRFPGAGVAAHIADVTDHFFRLLESSQFHASVPYLGPPAISVVSPWAMMISCAWLTVHAVLCVTVSISPAADGWPLPLFFTPPNGRCTSAPMHGRFT